MTLRRCGRFGPRLTCCPSRHAGVGDPLFGASLTGSSTAPRHTDTVAATRNEDKLAVDVYRRAETTGEKVTLGFVERHLDELRSHPPDCLCGLCTAGPRGASIRGLLRRAPLGRRDRGHQAAGGALAVEVVDRLEPRSANDHHSPAAAGRGIRSDIL